FLSAVCVSPHTLGSLRSTAGSLSPLFKRSRNGFGAGAGAPTSSGCAYYGLALGVRSSFDRSFLGGVVVAVLEILGGAMRGRNSRPRASTVRSRDRRNSSGYRRMRSTIARLTGG